MRLPFLGCIGPLNRHPVTHVQSRFGHFLAIFLERLSFFLLWRNPCECGQDLAVLARSGLLTADGLEALLCDEGRHQESGGRIGPPPAEQRVEPQAQEQDGGEVGADVGLSRVGVQ